MRQKVGIVFQDPDAQLFSASVEQELAFGPLNLGYSPSEVRKRVIKVMEALSLVELSKKPTHLLSYGQKKRVAIAAVLTMEPEVLVFDEPTAWLDPQGCLQIVSILDELNAQGKTVVLSTHDVDLAYSWADEVLVMSSGQKVAMGDWDEILGNNELLLHANLSLPWVMEVYQNLKHEGMIISGETPPRNRVELIEILKSPPNKTAKTLWKEIMV